MSDVKIISPMVGLKSRTNKALEIEVLEKIGHKVMTIDFDEQASCTNEWQQGSSTESPETDTSESEVNLDQYDLIIMDDGKS